MTYDAVESARNVLLDYAPGTTLPDEQLDLVRKSNALVGDLYDDITGEPPIERDATSKPASDSDS